MTTPTWTAQRMACQEDHHYYRYEVVSDTPDEHGKTSVAMLLTEEQARLIAEAPAMLDFLKHLIEYYDGNPPASKASEIIQRIEGEN